MPEEKTVQGFQNIHTDKSFYNQLLFVMRMLLYSEVMTAALCRVTAVEAGGASSLAGYVDVIPIVTQMDGQGNAVAQTEVYHLPYLRLQGGQCAVVIDPMPGDIGLVVATKSDSSNVRQGGGEAVQPGSFRKFDLADGMYIGGFLNKVPEVFIELKQNGNIAITAPGNVTVNAPLVTTNGDVIASGISLTHHVHSGCGGPSNSGPPVG